MTSSISDVSISIPTLIEIVSVLTLQAGFNAAVVVISTTLLGIAAGTIGAFVLLRNRALMGDTLAHCSLPGIALAFIISALFGAESKNLLVLLLGALISGVVGVATVQVLVKWSRLTEDTAMAVVLSSFFGLGVVLLSIIQSMGSGDASGLQNFIFGQTAAMGSFDAWLMLVVTFSCVCISVVFYKEFQILCFDESYAESQGWAISTIDFVMMGIVVAVTVVGLQAVGLLLIVALLIIPAAGARFWTDSLKVLVPVSATIGGGSGYLGATMSALLPRMPAGAVIVLVAGLCFFISFVFAPKRGILARIASQFLLSIRISREHLLREIVEAYEFEYLDELKVSDSIEIEELIADKKGVSLSLLPTLRSDKFFFSRGICSLLQLQGLLKIKNSKIFITQKGLAIAKGMVRNHRLWEEFLIQHTDFPITHVDFSADFVEHSLSPEIAAKLEEAVIRKNKALREIEIPQSVHQQFPEDFGREDGPK